MPLGVAGILKSSVAQVYHYCPGCGKETPCGAAVDSAVGWTVMLL